MNNKINVSAYTTGINVPSARYRVRQLIPYLTDLNCKITESPSKAGAYPPLGFGKRIYWALNNISENFIKVLQQPKTDIVWLQKPMFSNHYTFERFLKKPLIFDIDDALFLGNNGNFIKNICSVSDRIICGNSYLANYISNFNNKIDIIPTAVDISKYDNTIVNKTNEVFNILWTGTSSNYKYLYSIENALKIICDKFPFVKIKVISNSPPVFKKLSNHQFTFEYWSLENEFSSIKTSHLGIMPIFDDEFSKGKCSYKMLCYMAAKLPVVVSPFGMNDEVLKMGEIGFGAIKEDEWINSLETIVTSIDLASNFGENGYQVVKNFFDVKVISKQIKQSFHSVL
ncbi:hypothetical protein ACFRAE_10130 [Sphingobacterium sp. HJSM2_6]|uniref:hypothetical protein n=1 Tax=Sphingobacterium sp. HJSM2_6 TaxID=3366264 RepID=UPI003BE4DA7A